MHALLFERGVDITFVLSGSSARKLKRANANLLAGRALNRKMFALSCLEMGTAFSLPTALRHGMLPGVQNESNGSARAERLDAYVETYLKEEIQQEALVRNLDSFFRFLAVASVMNGQTLNISSVARDVGVSRSTVQGYFEILIDTLIGWFLPAFRLRAKVKEVAHPKFYLFDVGVQRALVNEHRDNPGAGAAGRLFESFILNEVRMLTSTLNIGAELSYWRTEAGTEVDLIWHRGPRALGFEIKHKQHWDAADGAGLETLVAEKKIERAFGIYAGERPFKKGNVLVLPYLKALDAIRTGEIGFDARG